MATPTVPLRKPMTDQTNGVNGRSTPPRVDAPDDGRAVALADYWADWYDHGDASYEWNNGYLEAKPMPTQIQLRLYNWFLKLLLQFLEVHPIAQQINLETGFPMIVPDPKKPGSMKKTVRKPDIGVIRHDNRITLSDTERSYKGICDLCVESLSDSTVKEVERDIKDKEHEYEFAGVQEYFILDPSEANMIFYRRDSATGTYDEIQPDADGIIRSAVLPGFQFRLIDLQRRPSLETLALDEVYQGYILPEYQDAVERAFQADERAARYAAKLLEMGVDIEDI